MADTMGKKDEAVDGAKLAAQILSHMGADRRTRIMQAIGDKDPQALKSIETNLLSFDDIAELTPQGIQLLIQETDPKDLILALKLAPMPVTKAIYASVSERKRASIQDDLKALPPTPRSEIELAQQRMVKTLDTLRSAGRVKSQSKSDVWV